MKGTGVCATFKSKYSVPGTGLSWMWSEGRDLSLLLSFLQLINIFFKWDVFFCRDFFFPVYASTSLHIVIPEAFQYIFFKCLPMTSEARAINYT